MRHATSQSGRRLTRGTIALLVVCGAMASLWATSHWKTLWVAFGHGESSWQFRSVDGVILVGRVMLPDWEQKEGLSAGVELTEWSDLNLYMRWPKPTLLNRIGFGLTVDGSTRRAAPWDVRVLMVPHWAFCLACLGLVWTRMHSGSQRGFDVTGHGGADVTGPGSHRADTPTH
jgi:hypothetical protein